MIHLALYICAFSQYIVYYIPLVSITFCYRAPYRQYSHRIPMQLKRLSSIVFFGSQISPVFRPEKCTLKYILLQLKKQQNIFNYTSFETALIMNPCFYI